MCYGKWQGEYTRFRQWRDEGILEEIFRVLSADTDMENFSIDSTSIKVLMAVKRGQTKSPRALSWRSQH